MATTKEEPWVKVTEQVVNNPAAAIGDDAIVIGGVIIAPCGPSLSRVTDGRDFLSKYTSDGSIPRNAHKSLINAYYLSQITPLVLARATNAKMYGGCIISKGLTATKCYFDENQNVLRYNSQWELTGIPVDEDGNFETFNLAIEDIVIYAGDMPELTNTVNLYEVTNFNDIISVLSNLGGFYFENITKTSGEGIIGLTCTIYSNQNTFTVGAVQTSTDPEDISQATVVVNLKDDEEIPEEAEWIMAMIGNEYSNQDYITFSLRKSGTQFVLEMLDDYNSGRYYISFNPNSVDSTGASNYADILNNQNFNFTVVVYDNALSNAEVSNEVLSNITIGQSPYNDSASESSVNVCSALNELTTQELYDIDGLCLFGLETVSEGVQITKQFVTTGQDNKWLCPVGVPSAYSNRRTIRSWVESLSLPEPNPLPGSIVLGPFDKDISTVGWTVEIDPGVKYWERVVTNANNGYEFAPVFKDTYGIMNMVNPALMLKKSDREILLQGSKPINWVCQNQRTGVYYLNQNWTYTNIDNVCEEENIVRTVWKISRDLNRILEQYFAQQNTRSTRQNVVDLVDYYFRWNVTNKQFAPEAYQCICDNTNNTDEVIRAHQLKVLVEVRYYGSIKWIGCINRSYPIGVEFSGEM